MSPARIKGVYHEAFWQGSLAPEFEALHKSVDNIFSSYNDFFNHIGIRKGWRVPPVAAEDVQNAFKIAAEVVALVRADRDEARGGGFIMRQVGGSSADFLWQWPAGAPPEGDRRTLAGFVEGLVLATLSDAHGLLEGLDQQTVKLYARSHFDLDGH